MEFLIITGLSGAGKSRAAGALEDLDYYCVDNMPNALIPQFAELCLATQGRYDRIALVTDIRERGGTAVASSLSGALEKVAALGVDYRILFLEAATDTIVKRYKETRRRHPLSPDGADIKSAVERERDVLADLRGRADFIIDTTNFPLSDLSKRLSELFSQRWNSGFAVNFTSFGFKYGPPVDADLIFDVRFLPNPYYIDTLAPLTGEDDAVRDYVMEQPLTKTFLAKLYDLFEFLIPCYIDEGKHSLTVSIGCTGGRHRSVAIARDLANYVAGLGYKTNCSHRDFRK
ncbi:MAG: RNase adapter RapZ [Oscillospiraceae bacterium]|jgi:UPF0042 nucleotide-binding protein|nr:RNase adapter RapZ [Oscillospiraceae bacterium]